MSNISLARGKSGRSAIRKAACAFGIAIASFLLCLPMFPQAAVGTILGGVFDSTGGAIANAKVTITDVARGTTRTLTTDASGQYTAPSLLSGTYTVRAEAAGFQALEQQNVVLEVAQDVRVDLKLTPGATTQTVTVTAEAPAIDTVNSTLGGTVSNTEVAALPLVSRNFLDLLQLRPGVVYVPGTPTATASNGRRQGSDVLLIEGVTQFDLGTSNVLINGAQKGGAVDELPLDSIQEFNTAQNPPAEYGWRDGSGVNIAVKSGTNSIHGSAYAFGRDAAATDAALFSAVGSESKNNLTVEQPGFTLGGPLVKNKVFWFVSAEFIRQSSFSPAPVTVPADATLGGAAKGCTTIATGDCGHSLFDACTDILAGPAPNNLINPLSAQIVGLVPIGATTQPTSCTPSPASSTVENLFMPSATGSAFPNPVTTTPSNNGLAKVDYSPNDKHHFDGFFFISRETTTADGSYQPYWGSLGVGRTEEYAAAWTWTPNSNWVNELRAGAAPNTGLSLAGDSTAIPSQSWTVGGTPTGYSINTGVTTPGLGLMCMTISGITGSSTGLGDCGKNGSRGPQYQLDFTDKVSWLHGNHAFKWGYEEVNVRFDDASTANQNGTVSFSNLESFLTGTTNSASIIVGNNTDEWREEWHAAFVQDTWRVTPRITLTPGVRWEYIGSPHSAVNHMGIFDRNATGGVDQVGPGLPVSTLIHPQKFNFFPRGGVAWDIFGNGKTVLRGGIGLLGSFPSMNTVAGASVPYGATLCTGSGTTLATICAPGNVVVDNTNNPALEGAIAQTFSFKSGSLQWPGNNTTAIFPASVTPTCPTPVKGSTPIACSMLTVDPNFKYPKSVQWNVDVQRAITNSLTLDVAYVGVHGYDETHSVDLNEPALGSGWDPNATTQTIFTSSAKNNCLGANPASPITPGPANNYNTNCAADTANEQLLRPFASKFPYYGFIVQTQSGFVSNYKALQATLTSRGYHGLSFIASYTLARAQDDWTKNSQATAALANPANPQYQYGNSDFDVRNRFRFSPVYAIPGTKKVPAQIAEGWSVSAIWALQNGFAWAPNDQTTNDWGGTGENADNTIPRPNSGVWQSWNFVGPSNAFNNNGDVPIPCYGRATGCTAFNATGVPASVWTTCSTAATAPYSTTLQQDLALAALTSKNGACYMQKGGILTPPAYGTLGDATRGMFVGPSFKNLDITISKMWKIKENYSVTFRAECFNCLNQVNILNFSDGSSDPSGGGGALTASGGFGYNTTGIIQEGGSSNRQFQFGLKIAF